MSDRLYDLYGRLLFAWHFGPGTRRWRRAVRYAAWQAVGSAAVFAAVFAAAAACVLTGG